MLRENDSAAIYTDKSGLRNTKRQPAAENQYLPRGGIIRERIHKCLMTDYFQTTVHWMRIAFGGMPGSFWGRALSLGMLPHLCEGCESRQWHTAAPSPHHLPCTFPGKDQDPLPQYGALIFLGCTLLSGWKVPDNIPTVILGKPGSGILAHALAFLSEVQQKEAAGKKCGFTIILVLPVYPKHPCSY